MRAIWSGSISFGLVNIPVKLFLAVTENRLNFDMLHEKDLSPIRFARVCKSEDKEVPYDQIVKGYEYEKGHFVVLSDEDFEKANIRLTKTISILNFVLAEEIEPIYFEKPYYLEPDKGAEKPYRLLFQALGKSKKVAVGKYVLRNREHLAVIRSDTKNDIIILEHIRYEEEIKDTTDLVRPEVSTNQEELDLALSLIDKLTKKFNPSDYHDTYMNELKRIIAEKVAGKVPSVKGSVPAPTKVPDLMAMLRQSLEDEKKKVRG